MKVDRVDLPLLLLQKSETRCPTKAVKWLENDRSGMQLLVLAEALHRVSFASVCWRNELLFSSVSHTTYPDRDKMSKAFRLFESRSHAELYMRHRPTYPLIIRDRIISFMVKSLPTKTQPSWEMADIGCGPGQSTDLFASDGHFSKIWGLDISEEQIRQARKRYVDSGVDGRLTFLVSPAETTPLTSASLHLVTCATAFHWFDHNAFFREVDRLLLPGGCLAVYGYTCKVLNNPAAERILLELLSGAFKNYTAAPNFLNRNSCRGMQFPYGEPERFEFSFDWATTVGDFVGYVSSWSEYQRYCKDHPGNDVLEWLKDGLLEAYGVERADSPVSVCMGAFLLMTAKPLRWTPKLQQV